MIIPCRQLLIESERASLMEAEKVVIESVDMTDPNALQRWAQSICRGGGIRDIASALGVPATVESVIDALTKDFPQSSRDVVAGVCRAEFAKSE